MAWVHIMPGYETIFRERGWNSAAPFLAWTGILVNRHRNRQVERVTLDAVSPSPPQAACGLARKISLYLKKQYDVAWSERFRNAWEGFGWCSTAVREAKLLAALRQSGVGCAEVVAMGEHDRQAFVVLVDRPDMTELRIFLQQLSCVDDEHRFADALGRELARLHNAGFEHPDLFAKHILAARDGGTFRFCVLDWQRGRRRERVSWWLRCRDLAVLDATVNEVLANDRQRLRCLMAYWRASTASPGRPPLRRLAEVIRQESAALRQKRAFRELGQLPVPAAEQQFVSLRDGRMLVVRAYFEKTQGRLTAWSPEDVRAAESDSAGERLCVRTWKTPPAAPLLWPLPPLAHVLFRLHRFSVPAPRLLAAARSASQGWLLLSDEATIPLEDSLAQAPLWMRAYLLEQAGWIIRQIHEAGYRLAVEYAWAQRLGVKPTTGEVVLVDAESLESSAADWRHLAQAELPALAGWVSLTDRLRFLRGYLQHRVWTADQRRWITGLLHQDVPSRERRVDS